MGLSSNLHSTCHLANKAHSLHHRFDHVNLFPKKKLVCKSQTSHVTSVDVICCLLLSMAISTRRCSSRQIFNIFISDVTLKVYFYSITYKKVEISETVNIWLLECRMMEYIQIKKTIGTNSKIKGGRLEWKARDRLQISLLILSKFKRINSYSSWNDQGE